MNQFGAQKFSFKKPFMILMFIGIGIGSVSADMKKILSAIYRIGRFEKWDLSVLIGIGRYEKKLIGRTLTYMEGTQYGQLKLLFGSLWASISAESLVLFP